MKAVSHEIWEYKRKIERGTSISLGFPTGIFMFEDKLLEIELKLVDRERLNRDDLLVLENCSDLASIFRLADLVRRSFHGSNATWIANVQVNPTNVCALTCKFCDFAHKASDPEAYELEPLEVVERVPIEVREAHIVGGLHPKWNKARYLSFVHAFKAHRPEIGIKAFTAVEVDYMAVKSRQSHSEILAEMKDAGVDLLPGGGAEVLVPRIREELYPFKINAETWMNIHRTAHNLGIKSNATLLYGHIETAEERVEHLLSLRELQDETCGFLSFVPLVYQPGTTKLREKIISPSARLKQIAISRLALDNIQSIKAYWPMLGVECASRALQCGADDLDGTIGRERIAHDAGAESPVGLMRQKMEELCLSAGISPIERDHLHRKVGTT